VKKISHFYLSFLLFTGILALGACATAVDTSNSSTPNLESGADAENLPLASPSLDANADATTPTATIVWFPPTETWTPFPTPAASAAVEVRPGLGAKSVSDDFSDPIEWRSARTESTGGNDVIVNRNRLTTAINVPPVYVFSLRNGPFLSNFYAEVAVRVNRCAPGDTYGMLFRAAGGADSYRYTLGCNGQVRAERMQANKVIPIQNWVPSGDVPPAAPGEVKLGVWASGVELRFFLNDRYQFAVIDPVFHNGVLGLFANGANPNGMNVSFSELAIYDVSYVSPTPTQTPRKTPTPTRTPRE
jgi:hypothetical protein